MLFGGQGSARMLYRPMPPQYCKPCSCCCLVELMSEMSAFVDSTTDGASSDTPTSLQSVFRRYPGILLDKHFIAGAVTFNLVIFFVWLIVGVVGNSLSAVVWLMRRMRRHNSSAIYVVALSANCLVFLVLYLVNFLNFHYEIQLYHLPVLCQLFNVLFFVPQYLTQLLVLAFTVDRYIVVCHPLRRQIYCHPGRAVKVCHMQALAGAAGGIIASLTPEF